MTVNDISARLGLETACAPKPDAVVTEGYASDLLSDVMANAPEDSVLVTIQAHKNTVAVASLAGVRAVVVCNGRSVPDDMRAAAEAEGIAILSTGMSQFEVSGRLYRELKA